MSFKLGDKVRINKEFKGKGLNGLKFVGSVYIHSVTFENAQVGGRIFNSIRLPNGSCNSYLDGELELAPTQTLYAYTDKKDEVHWTTRLYTKTVNFTRAEKFDKVIEL